MEYNHSFQKLDYLYYLNALKLLTRLSKIQTTRLENLTNVKK